MRENNNERVWLSQMLLSSSHFAGFLFFQYFLREDREQWEIEKDEQYYLYPFFHNIFISMSRDRIEKNYE